VLENLKQAQLKPVTSLFAAAQSDLKLENNPFLLRPKEPEPKKSLCVTENPLSSVDALKVYNQTKSREEEPEEVPMINLFELPGNSKAKARAAKLTSSSAEGAEKAPEIIRPSINLFGGNQAAPVIPKVDGEGAKVTLKLAPMTIKFSKEVEDKPKDEEEEENKENCSPNAEEKPQSKTKLAPSPNSTKIF